LNQQRENELEKKKGGERNITCTNVTNKYLTKDISVRVRGVASYLKQGQITSTSYVPYNSSGPLYTNI